MVTVKSILDIKGYEVYSVKPDQTVYDALKVLADKEIGAVLVKEGDKLIGIFSERDYARKLILKGFFSKESSVRDVMTKDLIFVHYDADIFECMAIMTEKKIRHLPVLENNKLIGLVSIGDVVNGIINSQQSAIKDLEGYIAGGGYGHMS
jgi:CBS domain-containing protein